MYLSKLTLNLRDAGVRRDLRNPYDLHRTILRGFPDKDAGGAGRVLFRVELPRGAAPFVLVQSDKNPDWRRLPDGFVPDGSPKALDEVAFVAGQRLRFRLRANPAKRAGKTAADPGLVGKRIGLCRETEQQAWLTRKGEEGGFRLSPHGVQVIPEGKVTAWKAEHTLHFLAVRFEGVLEVVTPDRFLQTLRDGVGPGKGLGFGLLSLARAEA